MAERLMSKEQAEAHAIWETAAANHLRGLLDSPLFTAEDDGDKRSLGSRGIGVSWKVWRSVKIIVQAYLREHPETAKQENQ